MSFYQLLFSRKLNGINRNLTWYWNLFAKYMRENVGTLLAKILKIKGNTLVWNQMLNDSFNKSLLDFTLSGHTYTFDFTSTTNTNWWQYQIYSALEYTAIANHKYLVKIETKSNYPVGNVVFNGDRSISQIATLSDGYVKRGAIFTSLTSVTTRFYFRPVGNRITANFHYENIFARNIQLFDLTQMGLDSITTVAEFEALFPLSYYAYDSGSLLSFNGSGIKTTGKNLVDVSQVQVGKAWNNTSNSARATLFLPILPNTTYTLSIQSMGTVDTTFIRQQSAIGSQGADFSITDTNKTRTFTTESDTHFLAIQANKTAITYEDYISLNWQLEFGSPATSYEPYTSSTKSLPISTYFPTGMKSAGNVYDELTESKAITRVGSRAYQSGDESDTSVVTDGTTTYYALVTPTEVSIDPPLDLSYEIEWGGTEQLLPENTSTPTTSPISATVEYPDGEHEDYYTYQEIEKNHSRLNRALSIMLGRNVIIENPQEPLNIIMRGE